MSNIKNGVPQGSILSPLLFFIYINNLSDSQTFRLSGLTTNARLFANDVWNVNLSATNLKSDLNKINTFANRWKKTSHHPLKFDNNSVKQIQFQKHWGVYLEGKLDCHEHLQNMFKNVNKTIRLLCKLQYSLPKVLHKATTKLGKFFFWPNV